VPVDPPEAWGAGVTYRRSADFREEGTGFYDRVYVAERPELFFKASAWRCVGPGGPIGKRRDSGFTAAEPEIAIVLARDGRILGFTLANDVSAWDIERDNPLYLPQSKVYNGCFSFGPVIVTPDEIGDPYALVLSCRVTRGGREVFAGEASTAQLKRRFEEIVAWLLRSNEIRTGTVLSTGTGIIQPMDAGSSRGRRDAVVPADRRAREPRRAGLMAASRGIERDPYQLRPEDVEEPPASFSPLAVAPRARHGARARRSSAPAS
jgi:2-dehydro-3-deoxy-D-arabinonate dehydratase